MGKNLQKDGKWCLNLKTEAACGTMNYVPASGGVFKQCGFDENKCSTKYGSLVCPIPSTSAPPSSSVAPSPPPFAPPSMAPSPSPPPFEPGARDCETLLLMGKNLQKDGKWCFNLKTEAECGTMNYVPASGGVFKQCGFDENKCSTKYGSLVCPIASTSPPPSSSVAPSPPPFAPPSMAPSPPPFAPSPMSRLTCQKLLSKGTNLQADRKWCNSLKSEAECGTMNYVPAFGGVFKQCGFDQGVCSTRYGHLVCPIPSP
jgi:hypothetical protein